MTGRKAKPIPAEAVVDGSSAVSTSFAQREPASVLPANEPLIAFAEEFGRLVARRLLADQRRGFSLPELLLGAAVVAMIWAIILRVLGWAPH